MAFTQTDLAVRDKQVHVIFIVLALLTIILGVGLMLTIALLPWGLLIFACGLIWMSVLLWIHGDTKLKQG